MTAVLSHRGTSVTAIDVFAGFGGSSQGIHASGADVLAAANHNEHAIKVHSANFPDTEHYRCDLVDTDSADYVDPQALPPARFAWFSPGCTHHSQANAKKLYEKGRQAMLPIIGEDDDFDEAAYANSERSRVTMSCVLRYTAKHRPEVIVVENVVEVCHWGPGRDGSTFRWWMTELRNLGYEVEPTFLNSAHFPPTPQSRDRIYIVAWRKGNRRPNLDYRPAAMCTSDSCQGRMVEAVQTWKPRQRTWPLERWGKYGQVGGQYYYTCPDCRAAVEPVMWPAYTAIDWTNLGPTIAERRANGMKDLAPATMERIRRGLAKFAGGPPLVIPAKAVWGTDRPVTVPFGTQTGQQDKALVVNGHVEALRSGRPRAAGLHEELATLVTNGGGQALVIKNYGSIAEAKYRSAHIAEPLGSVTMHPSEALMTAGISLPVAGNTHERPGQTRARSLGDPLFTQHTTQAFGFAHVPATVEMRGGGSKKSGQHPITDPLHGVTAGGLHHGLMSPGLFAKINGGPGDTAWHHAGETLNTVTGRDTHGLVVLPWVDQFRSDPAAVTEQLATVMTHLRHALASSQPIELDKITDDDLEQVRFRMLEPDPELRRAMAFGDDYILLGNKTQVTAGLGNAVTPPVAKWITERCLATLDPDPERV